MALPDIPVPAPPLAFEPVPPAPVVQDFGALDVPPPTPAPVLDLGAARFDIPPAPALSPELLAAPQLSGVPRPAAPLPIAPPPVPRPGAERATQIAEAQAAIESKLGQADDLDRQLEDARQRFVAAKTPEEREAIAADATRLASAREEIDSDVSRSQTDVETRVAQAGALANVEAAKAQEAMLLDRAAGSEQIRRDSERRAMERQRDLDLARSQLAQDRQSLRAALERGPAATNVAGTLASAFTELVRASKAKQVPNLAPIFETAWQRDRVTYQDALERARGITEITGDTLTDIAQQEREDEAARAAAMAELYAVTEEQILRESASAATDQARTQAAMVLPQLRQQRAQAEAAALAAREDAAMKRRESEAALAHRLAQTRKLEAEAAIAERKARGGGGVGARNLLLPGELRQLPPKIAERVLSDGVKVGKAYLRNADGTPVIGTTSAEARELRSTMAAGLELNSLINRALAMRSEYGQEMPGVNSPARQAMESLHAEMLLVKNKAAEAGALDSASLALFSGLVGEDLAGWYSNITRLRTTQDSLEARLNEQLSAKSTWTGKFALTRQELGAPERTVADTRARVEARPDFERGTVLPASERLAASRESRDVLIRELDGNIAEASKVWRARTETAVKTASADLAALEKEFSKEVPDDFDALVRARVDAEDDLRALRADADATGEEIRAAETAAGAARAAVDNAMTPRARALRSSITEQRRFREGLAAQLAKEPTRAQRTPQQREEAAAATQRARAAEAILEEQRPSGSREF